MTSIQDIPVEILAIIFGFQPNWFLPILSLVNTKFRHATELLITICDLLSFGNDKNGSFMRTPYIYCSKIHQCIINNFLNLGI